MIVVSPHGDDSAAGTTEHPVATLAEAQRRLRTGPKTSVQLTDGVWRLDRPLRLTAQDSGTPDAPHRWVAAPGARPVISGGVPVSGWVLHDPASRLFRATVPQVDEVRQVCIDGRLGERPWRVLDRDTVTVTHDGLLLHGPAPEWFAALEAADRAEVVCIASFTHRYAPVARVEPGRLVMQQPAWQNNNWGWDTLADPVEQGELRIVNVLGLIEPGQWYFDPRERALFYRAAEGDHPGDHEFVVPALDCLLQIAGTLDDPVHDLELCGLTFAHTSWLGPSSPVGYAGQQAGTFLGRAYPQPDDYLLTCQRSCPQFEATRDDWDQVPAAVQVSAATRVRFADNTFTGLGQVGLGIGNDARAHGAGVGLAVSEVTVHHNLFTQLAGGAVVVGGVSREAHHPRDPRATVREVRIDNNLVTEVAVDYMDMPGILATYVDGATIAHNELSHLPYDGIDIGFGWGANDPGGSPDYERRGLYLSRPVHTDPTTLRRTLVARNLVHHTKTAFTDGGAIYGMSADLGARVEENYLRDNNGSVGLYLDEGARFWVLQRNVVQGAPVWVFTNTYNEATTSDNLIADNWYDGGRTHMPEPEAHRNVLCGNVLVPDGDWPPAALQVIARAGIEPHLRTFDGVSALPSSSATGRSTAGR